MDFVNCLCIFLERTKRFTLLNVGFFQIVFLNASMIFVLSVGLQLISFQYSYHKPFPILA